MTLKDRLDELAADQLRRMMPDADRPPVGGRPMPDDWHRLERVEVKLDWLIERVERIADVVDPDDPSSDHDFMGRFLAGGG